MMKPPFPWFGGKSKVAKEVWSRFGDVKNYVEPFLGGGAVLFARPTPFSGVETVNDIDAFVANFFRSVIADPEEVANYAIYPVNEVDLEARHKWLCEIERKEAFIRKMRDDPDYHDPKVAGWWVWGICSWIGSGWCKGVWDSGKGVNRQLPHLGDAGKGVNRQCPHLGNSGQGVNRQCPHLGNSGQGVRSRFGLEDRNGTIQYMNAIMDRLRHVRVCCGDWGRVVTRGALHANKSVGIFLDPPYAHSVGRDKDLYNNEHATISSAVREWAIEHGDIYKIALCGYDTEHRMPDSWSIHRWKAAGGMGRTKQAKSNKAREVVWFSPLCKKDDDGMFNE